MVGSGIGGAFLEAFDLASWIFVSSLDCSSALDRVGA